MTREEKTKDFTLFVLPYYLTNNGDGSASMRSCNSIQEAEEQDENQSEGWGESSANELEIYLKDGLLYRCETDYVHVGKKLTIEYKMIPLLKVDRK